MRKNSIDLRLFDHQCSWIRNLNLLNDKKLQNPVVPYFA